MFEAIRFLGFAITRTFIRFRFFFFFLIWRIFELIYPEITWWGE